MMTFANLIQIKADDQTVAALDELCRRNSEKRSQLVRRVIRELAEQNGIWPAKPAVSRQDGKQTALEPLTA